MLPHVNISKQFAEPYKTFAALDAQVKSAVEQAGLSVLLAELVKIRVSQLNGCAFCLRMHTRDALAAGETTDRLAVLPAWWESQYFTDQEQAALTDGVLDGPLKTWLEVTDLAPSQGLLTFGDTET